MRPFNDNKNHKHFAIKKITMKRGVIFLVIFIMSAKAEHDEICTMYIKVSIYHTFF